MPDGYNHCTRWMPVKLLSMATKLMRCIHVLELVKILAKDGLSDAVFVYCF